MAQTNVCAYLYTYKRGGKPFFCFLFYSYQVWR